MEDLRFPKHPGTERFTLPGRLGRRPYDSAPDHVHLEVPSLEQVWGEAHRENWARRRVAEAGQSWETHLAKFDGTVLPRDAGARRAVSRVRVAPEDQDELFRVTGPERRPCRPGCACAGGLGYHDRDL